MDIKKMQVSDFVHLHVTDEHRSEFYRLMKEWDGNDDVRWAFYDTDVLWMRLKEAKER